MDVIDFSRQADDIGIDRETLMSLYSLFAEQTEKDLEELSRFINITDEQAIRDKAHHIKGASLNLEIDVLTDLALQIQLFSEKREWTELPFLFEKFRSEFNELKDLIERDSHG